MNPDRPIPGIELAFSPCYRPRHWPPILSHFCNTVTFRQIEDKIMPRCTHKGCGKEFDVANDTEEVCIYHPGAPVSVLHRYLFT
jgi:hypothetical protein